MNQSTSVYAIVPAGGIGKRMKSQKPKQFLSLNGEPILCLTLKALAKCNYIKKFFIPTVDMVYTRKILKTHCPEIDAIIIKNGKTRQESVENALEHIEKTESLPDFILVHDAVRALIQESTVNAVIEAAHEYGAAIAASRVSDTLKLARQNEEVQPLIKKNISREFMWLAQTPQVFKTEIIIEAYKKAKQESFAGTDSAGLVERLEQDIALVESPHSNIKITTQIDLKIAQAFIDG